MKLRTLLLLAGAGVLLGAVPLVLLKEVEVEPAPPPSAAVELAKPKADTGGPRAFEPITLMDPFRAVTEVATVAAADAVGKVNDDESVLGVEVGGSARAYPLNMMAEPRQEVLNDTLGGRQIAVTFCSRCKDGIVFDRHVGARTLTMSLPGLVWGSGMVMQDAETLSLWSQVLGEAEHGPLLGTSLVALPSVVTDWKTWRGRHPGTTVAILKRLSAEYRQAEVYGPGSADRFVLAIAAEGLSRAWPLSALRRESPANDRLGDRPVVAVYAVEGPTAGLFDRTLEGRELDFARRGADLVDSQTASTWDPATGLATAGPLLGKALTRLPGFLILGDAWREYHAGSTLWAPHVQ